MPQLLKEKKNLKKILENYKTMIVCKEKEGDSIQAQELREEMKGHQDQLKAIRNIIKKIKDWLLQHDYN